MIRYVTLNPTGNLTCLVLDPVAEKDRGRVTNALINRCEQVGYLETPKIYPGCARARLQMMGGEFCGNATMGTAAWLAMQDGLAIGEKEEIVLEVSGAEMPVLCMVRREIQGWTGRVDMPPVLGTEEIQEDGKVFTAVHMTGMTHLIHTGERMKKPEAEAVLRAVAAELPAPAVGLLQWEETEGCMTPLVYVRESRTMIWETACGSGSAAIGAWKALAAGGSMQVSVVQPGGKLIVEAETDQGRIQRIRLTGTIRIGETKTL